MANDPETNVKPVWLKSAVIGSIITGVALIVAAIAGRPASSPGPDPGRSQVSSPPPVSVAPTPVVYRGRVIDGSTEAVIPHAKVSIDADPTPVTVFTDAEGIFVATLAPANVNHDVSIRVVAERYDIYERNVLPTAGRLELVRLEPKKVASVRGARPGSGSEPHRPEPHLATDRNRFVNSTIAALNGRNILIVDRRLGLDFPLTARIAASANAVGSLFRPAFVSDGLFSKVHDGDLDLLRSLGIDGMQLIALGLKSVRTTTEEIAGSTVVRATVTFDVRMIFPARGYSSDTLSVSNVGVAFDDEHAISMATDEAVKALIQRLSGV